ncbi:hypothetical protein SAMN05421770_101511 [Granulicella rosea]|uniref:Uncharacterized protein n=1 Tax=Granulicella rosea TaxID=474952 RepID=A0A239DKV4_9BACT|nr:hypothetical protein [Granulicella rosea]SNS32681.1 hypothetical protein SAMN05421770_101511 [Granulicella rosea]
MRWVLCLFVLAIPASAQVTRVPTGLKPRLSLGVFTITCTPTTASLALVSGGVSAASPTIAITSTWAGISLIANMNLYAYFTSSTQALSSTTPAGYYIASSQIKGQMPTGSPTSYTAFTQTGPFGGAGASLQLFAANNFLSLGGSRTDNLTLEIDLSSTPQMPANTFTGVMYLQAQAF